MIFLREGLQWYAKGIQTESPTSIFYKKQKVLVKQYRGHAHFIKNFLFIMIVVFYVII